MVENKRRTPDEASIPGTRATASRIRDLADRVRQAMRGCPSPLLHRGEGLARELYGVAHAVQFCGKGRDASLTESRKRVIRFRNLAARVKGGK